jgi:lipopolysaccharide transport system permease protein
MSVAVPDSSKPLAVLRPISGWRALNLRELWQYRDLLFSFATRDIMLRYRQTALGAAWVVIQPLLTAGILSFVFNRVAKLPTDGIPPFVFSFAGMLAYNAFANTLSKASACMVQNAQMISKVFFPRIILPLSTILSTLVDFSVALGMMAVLLLKYQIFPGIGILLLPVWLLLILALAVGLGLFAAALTVTYRDVQYIVPVLMQLLLYATPVAYAVSNVPKRFHTLFFLNPLSGLIEAFRWSLLGHGHLPAWMIAYSVAFSLAALLAGALYFVRVERRFADVI